ncbi:Afadin [Schistosoma japonicum]|nr:Afadin [Schistosoma japonicum]
MIGQGHFKLNILQTIPDYNVSPNRNEFSGVVRFFFRGDDGKYQSKCIRITNTATARHLVNVLVEKFHPDLRMLTAGRYAIYEYHENSGERRLGADEAPLLVQLNWTAENQEGRFILRDESKPQTITRLDSTYQNGSATVTSTTTPSTNSLKKRTTSKSLLPTENTTEDKQTTRGFVRRWSSGSRKKRRKSSKNRSDAIDEQERIPDTTFTRTLSNPDEVLRRRRQQRSLVKIYGGALNPTIPYILLPLSPNDTAEQIVLWTLEKYNLLNNHIDSRDYCLVMVNLPLRNGTGGNTNGMNGAERLPQGVDKEITLHDKDCVLKFREMIRSNFGISNVIHIRHRYMVGKDGKRPPLPPPTNPHVSIQDVSGLYQSNYSSSTSSSQSKDVKQLKHSQQSITDMPYLVEIISDSDHSAHPRGFTIDLTDLFTRAYTLPIKLGTVENGFAKPPGPALIRVNGIRVTGPILVSNNAIIQLGKTLYLKYIQPIQIKSNSLTNTHNKMQITENVNNKTHYTTKTAITAVPMTTLSTNRLTDKLIDSTMNEKNADSDDGVKLKKNSQFTTGTLSKIQPLKTTVANNHHNNGNKRSSRSLSNLATVTSPSSSDQLPLSIELESATEMPSDTLMDQFINLVNHILTCTQLELNNVNNNIQKSHEDLVKTRSFYLAPAYALYLTYRACIKKLNSVTSRCQPAEREHCISHLTNYMATRIYESVPNFNRNSNSDPALIKPLTYWLGNMMYGILQPWLSCLTYPGDLDLQDDVLLDDKPVDLTELRSKRKEPISMQIILQYFTYLMQQLRKSRVNPALTFQLYSQLFHLISAHIFNTVLIDTEAKPRNACQLIMANRTNLDEFYQHCISLISLNSIQLEWLLAHLSDPPPVPDDWIDIIVTGAKEVNDRAYADEIEHYISSGQASDQTLSELQLNELKELPIPLLLPADGYASDAMLSGIPDGLLDFLRPLIKTGLIRVKKHSIINGHLENRPWTNCMRLSMYETERDNRNQHSILKESTLSKSQQIHAVPNNNQQYMQQEHEKLDNKLKNSHSSLSGSISSDSTTSVDSNGSNFKEFSTQTVRYQPNKPIGNLQKSFNHSKSMNKDTRTHVSLPDLCHANFDQLAKEANVPIKSITQIFLKKLNNSLGLSIVAAKAEGQHQYGIYVKEIVQNGAADYDGRLKTGDQILAIGNTNLIGCAQSDAVAKISKQNKSDDGVQMIIAKKAAHYHKILELIRPNHDHSVKATTTSATMRHNHDKRYLQSSGIPMVKENKHHRLRTQTQQDYNSVNNPSRNTTGLSKVTSNQSSVPRSHQHHDHQYVQQRNNTDKPDGTYTSSHNNHSLSKNKRVDKTRQKIGSLSRSTPSLNLAKVGMDDDIDELEDDENYTDNDNPSTNHSNKRSMRSRTRNFGEINRPQSVGSRSTSHIDQQNLQSNFTSNSNSSFVSTTSSESDIIVNEQGDGIEQYNDNNLHNNHHLPTLQQQQQQNKDHRTESLIKSPEQNPKSHHKQSILPSLESVTSQQTVCSLNDSQPITDTYNEKNKTDGNEHRRIRHQPPPPPPQANSSNHKATRNDILMNTKDCKSGKPAWRETDLDHFAKNNHHNDSGGGGNDGNVGNVGNHSHEDVNKEWNHSKSNDNRNIPTLKYQDSNGISSIVSKSYHLENDKNQLNMENSDNPLPQSKSIVHDRISQFTNDYRKYDSLEESIPTQKPASYISSSTYLNNSSDFNIVSKPSQRINSDVQHMPVYSRPLTTPSYVPSPPPVPTAEYPQYHPPERLEPVHWSTYNHCSSTNEPTNLPLKSSNPSDLQSISVANSSLKPLDQIINKPNSDNNYQSSISKYSNKSVVYRSSSPTNSAANRVIAIQSEISELEAQQRLDNRLDLAPTLDRLRVELQFQKRLAERESNCLTALNTNTANINYNSFIKEMKNSSLPEKSNTLESLHPHSFSVSNTNHVNQPDWIQKRNQAEQELLETQNQRISQLEQEHRAMLIRQELRAKERTHWFEHKHQQQVQSSPNSSSLPRNVESIDEVESWNYQNLSQVPLRQSSDDTSTGQNRYGRPKFDSKQETSKFTPYSLQPPVQSRLGPQIIEGELSRVHLSGTGSSVESIRVKKSVSFDKNLETISVYSPPNTPQESFIEHSTLHKTQQSNRTLGQTSGTKTSLNSLSTNSYKKVLSPPVGFEIDDKTNVVGNGEREL